jgi:hypothetical protein
MKQKQIQIKINNHFILGNSFTCAYSPGWTFGLPFRGFLITHIQHVVGLLWTSVYFRSPISYFKKFRSVASDIKHTDKRIGTIFIILHSLRVHYGNNAYKSDSTDF